MRAVLTVPALVLLSISLLAGCAAPSSSEPVGAGTPAPSAAANDPKGGVKQATAAGIKPLGKTKFGSAITETSTVTLPAIMKEPGSFTNKTVRTEGMVSAVCQSMGCWMQIADTSGKAHIKMAGHSFFVPKESSGHRAIVQGKVLSGATGAACGNDSCGNQEATQVEIEATGIEFID